MWFWLRRAVGAAATPLMTAAAMTGAMAGAITGAMAGPVAAETIYEAISPRAALDILTAEAGALSLNDSDGDVTLKGRIGDRPFEVYFYECDGGDFTAPARPDSACLGLEFRAYFDGYPNDAELVNAWNNAHHYGALWRDDDEDLALQLNVVIEGGVTAANIRANYVWWLVTMQSLDDFIGGD